MEVLEKIRKLRKESEKKRETMMVSARDWQMRSQKAQRNRVSQSFDIFNIFF